MLTIIPYQKDNLLETYFKNQYYQLLIQKLCRQLLKDKNQVHLYLVDQFCNLHHGKAREKKLILVKKLSIS